MTALVVDAQRGLVDFDGDDLTGIAQPDLDALADELGAPRQDTVRCTRAGRWSKIGAGPAMRAP